MNSSNRIRGLDLSKISDDCKACNQSLTAGWVVLTRPEVSKPATRQARPAAGPNKTEATYNRERLGGAGRYEAITFRLPGGSRYTPDFYEPPLTVHEVKGSYRFGSHGRALTAFREAAAAFPAFRFIWAEKRTDGWFVKLDLNNKEQEAINE
jgi:hypothetical protein